MSKKLKVQSRSHLNGFLYISNKDYNPLRRGLWLVILLGSSGAIAFFAYAAIKNYFAFPTVSDITVHYLDEVPFPSITLCNMNALRRSYYEWQLANEEAPFYQFNDYVRLLIKNGTVQIPGTIVDKEHIGDDEIGAIMSSLTIDKLNMIGESYLQAMDHVDFIKLYRKGGHQFSNMVLNCENSVPYTSTDCRVSSDFSTGLHNRLCHTVHFYENGTDIKAKSRSTDDARYLEMHIDLQPSEYLLTPYEPLLPRMFVALHFEGAFPSPSDFFLLDGGFVYLFNIEEKHIHNLPFPYGTYDCVDTKESGYEPLDFYDNYSQGACKSECLSKMMNAQCGCKRIDYPGENIPTCNYSTTFSPNGCLSKFDDNKVCSQRCLQNCKQLKYTADFKREANFGQAGRLSLFVEFKEFAYTEITQKEEYPATSLFGELGGHLGLFLGASLLTVIEVVDLLAHRCVKSWGKCHRKEGSVGDVETGEVHGEDNDKKGEIGNTKH